MSIVSCDDCGTFIDTDNCPESYCRVRRDNAIKELCLCYGCQAQAFIEEEVLPDINGLRVFGSGFHAWEQSAWKRQYGILTRAAKAAQ